MKFSSWLALSALCATLPGTAADLDLAHTGSSNIHSDAEGSNTHAVKGPESASARIQRYRYGIAAGECATFAFDSRGRIVTVCAKATRSDILLVDPDSLKILATHRIPRRKGTILKALTFRLGSIFGDTSGGSYFFLDSRDRVVLATADRHLIVVALTDAPAFRRVADFELSSVVPSKDRVTSVLSGISGRYWFVTRQGRVGTVDPATGRIAVLPLNEEIENSFVTAKEGAYVVSDHALYLLDETPEGAPHVVWRETYDRGTRTKSGQINQGSGTTPTLLPSYVIIADNAEPQEHVLVYRRSSAGPSPRLVCAVPVFSPNRNALENSVIAFGRSIIIENNFGYRNPFDGSKPAGGFERFDIAADESGCRKVWESAAVSPSSVSKLSIEGRIVYGYGYAQDAPDRAHWNLFGLDFETGATRFSIPTGQGRAFDNSWASIAIGPRPGEAWVGTFSGFLRISDR